MAPSILKFFTRQKRVHAYFVGADGKFREVSLLLLISLAAGCVTARQPIWLTVQPNTVTLIADCTRILPHTPDAHACIARLISKARAYTEVAPERCYLIDTSTA